jgi:DNA-binding Xre family transcriptional regulator
VFGKITNKKRGAAVKKSLIQWLWVRRMTQVQLARETGLAPATISRLVKGKHPANMATIVAICKALHIRHEELDIRERGSNG